MAKVLGIENPAKVLGVASIASVNGVVLAVAPTLATTTTVTAITDVTASSGGNVTDDGGASITARGVCWNTSGSPTTSDSKTTDGTGTGAFTSSLTSLSAGQLYYVRSYATNSVGTSYGTQVSFTSLHLPVLATTTTVTAITDITASSGGNVTDDGGASITARGVCWNTSGSPTTSNSKTTDGTGTGAFTSSLTSLSAGQLYYVRSYATNSVGTSYGAQVSFTSLHIPVLATTTTVTSITDITASSGGNVTDDGGASITARGICWSTSSNPTTANSKTTNGTGTGTYASSLTSLGGIGQLYYVRSYATNSVGTGYGAQVSFNALYTYMVATGGTITTSGDYKTHTFNSGSTFTVSAIGQNATYGNKVDYLVVAGGGGGGGAIIGGGGGAGEVDQVTGSTVTATGYSVTVGAGGAGQDNNRGINGSNSVFSSTTSLGGGNGGQYLAQRDGGNGGSGGGAGPASPQSYTLRGDGVDGANTGASYLHGHNGGNGSTTNESGGGGGAVNVGLVGVATTTGGDGGPGLNAADTLSTLDIGGGGGGTAYSKPRGEATHGGGAGGRGGTSPTDPEHGTANTGGGGGGCERSLTIKKGGSGGSGVVIIRYKFQ
jgi:hypothetical protein